MHDRNVDVDDRILKMLGEPGLFRRVSAAEQGKVCAHLLRLSKNDRLLRFGSQTSDQQIRSYCDALDRRNGIIIGYFVLGELRAIGELKPFGKIWFDEAEVALSVETSWQNRGIGGALLQRLITTARNRMIQTVYLQCLPQNEKLKRLVRKVSGDLTFHRDQVEARLRLAWPDQFTVIQEILDEADALFLAMRDRVRAPLDAAAS